MAKLTPNQAYKYYTAWSKNNGKTPMSYANFKAETEGFYKKYLTGHDKIAMDAFVDEFVEKAIDAGQYSADGTTYNAISQEGQAKLDKQAKFYKTNAVKFADGNHSADAAPAAPAKKGAFSFLSTTKGKVIAGAVIVVAAAGVWYFIKHKKK